MLSAVNDASFTPCVWPCSTCVVFHVDVLQSRTVMSAELVSIHLPSAENLTDETAFLWPVSVCVQTYLTVGGASDAGGSVDVTSSSGRFDIEEQESTSCKAAPMSSKADTLLSLVIVCGEVLF